LLGHDAQGTSLAYYDPDSFDWIAWQTTSFHATSGAASATGVVLVGIGPGPDHLLCDVTLDNAVVWGPTKCHPALPVFDGGEILVPPPQVVALSSGDHHPLEHRDDRARRLGLHDLIARRRRRAARERRRDVRAAVRERRVGRRDLERAREHPLRLADRDHGAVERSVVDAGGHLAGGRAVDRGRDAEAERSQPLAEPRAAEAIEDSSSIVVRFVAPTRARALALPAPRSSSVGGDRPRVHGLEIAAVDLLQRVDGVVVPVGAGRAGQVPGASVVSEEHAVRLERG
jgi:hypothetical protein